MSKDLRRLLGRREKGRFSRIYCGALHPGRQTRRRLMRGCRGQLLHSLIKAARTPASKLYQDDVCKKQGKQGFQARFDSVYFRPPRRDHTAADPVDQPPDVPAGGGGAEPQVVLQNPAAH